MAALGAACHVIFLMLALCTVNSHGSSD